MNINAYKKEFKWPWVPTKLQLPAVGERVILFGNGVVQQEIYYLDAADKSDFYIEYFWARDELEEGVEVTDDQFWLPLPTPPKK